MRAVVAVAAALQLAVRAAAAAEPVEVNDPSLAPADLRVPAHPSASALEALGRQLFFDPALSASHARSCASCHDPAHAYGPANARPVQRGGVTLSLEGTRAVPSLRYLHRVPVFTEHYFDEDIDESVDNGPAGGLTWDGRVRSPREQARIPLLSPLEMANASPEAVVRAVAAASYAREFREVFGRDILARSAAAFDAITLALETFQQDPQEFYPYSSKFDAFLRRESALSAAERRGLELFNDPGRGNCAHCHPSTIGSSGAFPAFTDFGYVALGVPRNGRLAVNRDPAYHDLGLCGPLRTDLRERTEYCGMFRTPSLRNVALRRTFFHNGVFHSLRQVLEFYAERDLNPGRWYARDATGTPRPYDDLPAAYRDNVTRETPFDRKPGDSPALSSGDIDDLIAFLATLTDGWSRASARRASLSPP